MEEHSIYITEYDLKRLRELIKEAKRVERRGNEYLDNLDAELARGQVVAPTEIPPDVITLNSRVHLVDLDTTEEMVYTLVFPQDADIAQSKISVLAPIGTAMLGYRVGDTFLSTNEKGQQKWPTSFLSSPAAPSRSPRSPSRTRYNCQRTNPW